MLLFTDGLERKAIDDLGAQMERLSKCCRRPMWLSPLSPFERFEPGAAGMRAMPPHVEEMSAIHNVKSMAELCAAISGKAAPASDLRAWLRAVS